MHTIQAEIEFTSPDGEVFYPVIEIAYNYLPGAPAVMYGPGAGPAESAEVEAMDVTLIDDGGMDTEVDAATMMKWADAWLTGEGYYKACEEAESDYGD